MKKILVWLGVALLLAILLVGCATPQPETKQPTPAAPAPAPAPKQEAKEPITLKTVMAWPQSAQNNIMFLRWVKEANDLLKGELVFKIIGGPEAIPFAEQIGALQKNVVDVVYTAGGYYTGDIPEVYTFLLSRQTPLEERKSGYYDLMNKIHQEKGLTYLGRTNAGAPLGNFFLNVEVKKPKDMAGLKIRSMPVYDPIIKELGAVGVTMQESEIYNAMQQHVVDGYIKPVHSGIVAVGLHEVTKYMILGTFYSNPAVIVANNSVWNKIPDNLRQKVMESIMNTEKIEMEFWTGEVNKEIKNALDKGMKTIEFSPEDAKWLDDTAYKLAWDVTLPKTPKYGAQLKELLSK